MIFEIKGLKNTNKFINSFLISLVKKELKKRKKLIVIFKGNLGAGKTTFIKKLAKQLKIKDNITSPTFILWQIYKFNLDFKEFYFNHIDLYRIKPQELLKISLAKKLNENFNLFLIEWGEKLIPYLRRRKFNYLFIEIKIKDKKERLLQLQWKK